MHDMAAVLHEMSDELKIMVLQDVGLRSCNLPQRDTMRTAASFKKYERIKLLSEKQLIYENNIFGKFAAPWFSYINDDLATLFQ